MTLSKVEDEIEPEAVSLIETLLGEVFSCRSKHDANARKLLLESLLNVVVVSAAADT